MRIQSKHPARKVKAGYCNSLPLLAVHDHDIDCRMTALELACRLAITPKDTPQLHQSKNALHHALKRLLSMESTNTSTYLDKKGRWAA